MKKWYILQCKPRQLLRARMNLENQNYCIWYPTHLVNRIARRQNTVCSEAVFPGYLFIELEENRTNWRALNSTRGVSRVLSLNGAPIPVPEDLMASLREKYKFLHDPLPLYKAGDIVRITEGCFCDINAIVKAVTPDDRVVILLRLLHREHSLTLSPAQLAV
ncbi:transcription/translation regulatory transformer protein RfaH [Pseudohongiella sp. O18]|uniref:transcription/translation regulatory transformer protein RfaH n=1 Tax=Pseudohongiella sp. O18 TaxID=2904248 RepID=UPI001F0325F8|nr:transcription/translation regulatory transformer protein RfaH [Pseudohongiella sp. O18]